MRYYVVLLMPIFWAIVSTIIGLILYRTSSALFTDSRESQERKKGLRLTGSVVIAAGAFLLMKMATPDQIRTPIPEGTVLVDQVNLAAAMKRAQEVEKSLVKAGACTAIDQSAVSCAKAVEAARDLATALRTDVETLPHK